MMSLKEQKRGHDKGTSKQRSTKPATKNLGGQIRQQPHPATLIRRARLDPGSLSPGEVLQLQRTTGNQAVRQLLAQNWEHPSIQQELHQPNRPDRLKAGIENLSGLAVGEESASATSETSTDVIQRFPVQVEHRGNAHRIRGGTSMTAKVGAASEWNYGSVPPGGVPNLLTKVGAAIQGKPRYIAGHLLNDNMGGLGVNDNLTVLSSDANKKHTGIEGKVKKLAQKADAINLGNNALGNPAYDHGARYKVEVLDPQPAARTPFSPQEKYIGAGLRINIDPIRIDKRTHQESVWPEEAGGDNDLTNHRVDNVPPYPPVPEKKGLTPVQAHIVEAIIRLNSQTGSLFKEIWRSIETNVKPSPTEKGVMQALKKGVSSKFFSKRGGRYKVIAKNIPQ